MKFINLIEKLSDKDAGLLAKVGIKMDGLKLECLDDRNVYFKQNDRQYSIYCYDDKTPVASIFIKRDIWDTCQIVSVNEKEIEAALERMSNLKDVKPKAADYPNYEERKMMVKQGNHLFLFDIPFSELRYDEQELVKKNGFKVVGSEKYSPLSSKGKEIVDLIKSTRTQLDFIKSNSSFFAGRDDSRRSMFQHHADIWNSLLDGTHKLVSGLSKEQIDGYFDLALEGVAPSGFKELDEDHGQHQTQRQSTLG